MPDPAYAILMARYNAWQNESLISAANGLPAEERRMDRGAFFGSIERTFSHLLWGDRIWLSRFSDFPAPGGGIEQSSELFDDWPEFVEQRKATDRSILDWAQSLQDDWFSGDLTWRSGATNRDVTKPKSVLIVHFFNHQTHHRGQIHAMLTAAGAKTDHTDIPFMPEPPHVS